MNQITGCNPKDHTISRRSLLAGLVASAPSICGLGNATVAAPINTSAKRLLIIFQVGGVSQLESWDPKPGTATGGPFQAIPTSVPGIHHL